MTDEYGRWAWYKGVTSPVCAKDATVLAVGGMLSSSREWDVYVGAGRGVNDTSDMIYSAATYVSNHATSPLMTELPSTSEVEFYFPNAAT